MNIIQKLMVTVINLTFVQDAFWQKVAGKGMEYCVCNLKYDSLSYSNK